MGGCATDCVLRIILLFFCQMIFFQQEKWYICIDLVLK